MKNFSPIIISIQSFYHTAILSALVLSGFFIPTQLYAFNGIKIDKPPVVERIQKEADKAADSIIPDKVSCAQWTAHPYYAQTVFAIKDNKGELSRNGIHDVSSCKDARDTIVALLASKYGLALAGVSWDLGRCACEDAY